MRVDMLKGILLCLNIYGTIVFSYPDFL